MCCNTIHESQETQWIFLKSIPAFKENQYLDLPLHSDAEEGDEVHDEDRPEHGDVENLEKGTAESNHLELTKFIDVVSRKIMMMKVTVALVAEYQNLNSGKRLEIISMILNL